MNTIANDISLRNAALIAGLALFFMAVAAPFIELYIFPKLGIPYKATETARNIIGNKTLFTFAIFGYLLTFILDIVVAWALYILLKPVNGSLSLLTACFRIIYTIIALAALLNLVTVLKLLTFPGYLTMYEPEQLYKMAMIHLRTFKDHWYFGIIFFGIHLCLLGYSVLRSSYIPKILGVFLLITGIGYLLTTIGPYLFPGTNVDFARYTFYGELIFMLWLIIKGPRIKDITSAA
jgi:hypothetical protein